MYYIKKIVFFVKKIIFNYFDGSGSGSGYPRIIEYRDGYPKPGYPETTNLDPDIKSTDPTDQNTLNFSDIRIRPRTTTRCIHKIKRIHKIKHREYSFGCSNNYNNFCY